MKMTGALRLYFSGAYSAAAEEGETIKKSQWIAESLSKRPIPGVELVAPKPLTVEQMATVHDPAYLNALQTGEPRSLAESCGLMWDVGL